MTPHVAQTDEEIASCFAVMHELRPHLAERDFVARVRRQYDEGYRLAYLTASDEIVAVTGFRLLHNLASGRVLYVDDLVTAGLQRSRGHGRALLAWLHDHARALRCDTCELDSGFQRVDAHRFYEREGMTKTSFHFRTVLHDGG